MSNHCYQLHSTLNAVAVRYAFGGVAEVTAAKLGKYLIAVTGEISRLGCFV